MSTRTCYPGRLRECLLRIYAQHCLVEPQRYWEPTVPLRPRPAGLLGALQLARLSLSHWPRMSTLADAQPRLASSGSHRSSKRTWRRLWLSVRCAVASLPQTRQGSSRLRWTLRRVGRISVRVCPQCIGERTTVKPRLRMVEILRVVADSVNYRLRKKSPFVTQDELSHLLLEDRSTIDWQLRLSEEVSRRPGGRAQNSPRLIAVWKAFVEWVDETVEYLDQPRATSDLERVVRDWRDRRKDLAIAGGGWNRRSDVIALGN